MKTRNAAALAVSMAAVLVMTAGGTASAQPPAGPPGEGAPRPDFPPFAEVAKDFTKVVSTSDGEPPLYGIYIRDKDQAMLAELPRDFGRQKLLIAMTVSSGEIFAGLQGPELYAYWKRYDKRLALVEPQIVVRSTGDAESKTGVERVFTDRVVLDVPIMCMGPNGGPVIDMRGLLTQQAGRLIGGGAAAANPVLATIKKAKAFPQNVELAYEMPTGNGVLKTFHYSWSVIPDSTGYQPRQADERIGYFTTWFRDLGKFKEDEKWVRYVNRWHLEKADPKLKMSPPKKPIVFYVEHTVPVRYRRYVREGALWWNKAFERVGITDAVEVYFQDKATGAHMDKDPEDVRYNFLRWVTNDIATAIGPSRAHPLTGQILDADVVLTDGWIRAFWREANEIIPDLAMRGVGAELTAWFDKNPEWDPRVRLAAPERRDEVVARLAVERRGVVRFGGIAAGGDDAAGGMFRSQMPMTSGSPNLCMAAQGKAIEMSVARMSMELADLLNEAAQPEETDKKDEKKGEKKDEEKKEKPDLLDGIPEWFVGQALADLTAHEVGHTLGLRHNFKASSVYDLKDINSEAFKGKKAFTASVMDYNPVNINMDKSLVQGDYNMRDIGVYDMWAIEFGYTFGDTKKVLERVAEPELAFGSDEDVGGIDPTVRQYDFAKDPRDYAVQRMELAKYARGRILEKFVKSGESWSKARRGYLLTLNMQGDAVSIMANWVGTARVYRDRKGDPNGRAPIEVVPAAQQRAALKFVIDNAFSDEVFGLTPDLVRHLTIDRFEDPGAGRGEPAWPVYDQIAGVQAATLSFLINPVKLRRVYDNEFRVPSDQDALTLPELLDSVVDAIWTELDGSRGGTARKPAISNLRRNLQQECLKRLIDLSFPGGMPGEAGKAISTLATAKLKQLRAKMDPWLKSGTDPYTAAHMAEAARRIDKALDAQFILNTGGGGGGIPFFMFGQPAPAADTTGEDWRERK